MGSICIKPITVVAPSNTSTVMDEANKKAVAVLVKEGPDKAVEHMFNPTGKKQLSYAEMRALYG